MVGGPFRGSEAVAAGLVTRHQLHGPRFRRVFPDVYVPAGADLSLLNRSLAAFELVRDKLAIEYDGAVHFERRRAIRDRQRDAELAGYGWLTLRLTPDDLFTMPQTTHRIRDLLAIRRP